jgi:hypothetical protein
LAHHHAMTWSSSCSVFYVKAAQGQANSSDRLPASDKVPEKPTRGPATVENSQTCGADATHRCQHSTPPRAATYLSQVSQQDGPLLQAIQLIQLPINWQVAVIHTGADGRQPAVDNLCDLTAYGTAQHYPWHSKGSPLHCTWVRCSLNQTSGLSTDDMKTLLHPCRLEAPQINSSACGGGQQSRQIDRQAACRPCLDGPCAAQHMQLVYLLTCLVVIPAHLMKW